MKTIKAAPSAAILIESMRDVGYHLETALADIIDNSITAGAATIELFAEPDESGLRIGILDDGQGMSEKELIAAMRPGSRNPLEERALCDLGRFGLGLKTASFSQCRRLTVVTRSASVTIAAIWDLDHVAKVDDWLVQIPENPGSLPWADRLRQTGTLIIWEKLDRLSEDDGTGNEFASFVSHVDEAREHLELVFHRFLAGERGLRKVRLNLNGRPLEPFDPFHSGHPATISGPLDRIKLGSHVVTVQTSPCPITRKSRRRNGSVMQVAQVI